MGYISVLIITWLLTIIVHVKGTDNCEGNAHCSILKQNSKTDNPFSADSKFEKPALREYMLNQGVSNDVFLELQAANIEWNVLLYINQKDLEELCGSNQLDLSFRDKIQFKAAVMELQSKYKKPDIIQVTTIEQEQINKIESALKQNNNLQKLFIKHSTKMDEYIINIKSSVNEIFERSINKLIERNKTIHSQIDQWEESQSQQSDVEIANLINAQYALQKVKLAYNHLLQKEDINSETRQQEIQDIVHQIFASNHTYKKYLSAAKMESYINDKTKLLQVDFAENKLSQMIAEYGQINDHEYYVINETLRWDLENSYGGRLKISDDKTVLHYRHVLDGVIQFGSAVIDMEPMFVGVHCFRVFITMLSTTEVPELPLIFVGVNKYESKYHPNLYGLVILGQYDIRTFQVINMTINITKSVIEERIESNECVYQLDVLLNCDNRELKIGFVNESGNKTESDIEYNYTNIPNWGFVPYIGLIDLYLTHTRNLSFKIIQIDPSSFMTLDL